MAPESLAPERNKDVSLAEQECVSLESLHQSQGKSLAPSFNYRGRFAPSPSGHLHFGSLLSGYGALWRARSMGGKFLVRIEDLDFTRCTPLNLLLMSQDLELFALRSDEDMLIQLEEQEYYEHYINLLLQQGHAYYCTCNRSTLKKAECTCNTPAKQAAIRARLQECTQKTIASESNATPAPAPAVAIRLDLSLQLQSPKLQSFCDSHLGKIKQDMLLSALNPVLTLKRSDGCIAYNLAVVLDDQRQHISEVVRGSDMLEVTFLQLALYHLLGFKAPDFCHLPLLVEDNGQKFSKQNNAPAVSMSHCPHEAILKCWELLQPHSTERLLKRAQKSLQALGHIKESLLKALEGELESSALNENKELYLQKLKAQMHLGEDKLQQKMPLLWPQDINKGQIFTLNSILSACASTMYPLELERLKDGYELCSAGSNFGIFLLQEKMDATKADSLVQQSRNYYETLEELQEHCAQDFDLTAVPSGQLKMQDHS